MVSDGSSFTLARRERDKQRKNADILDAAERVFQRRSYHLATMEEIAREAGFAVGTLYNLFEGKEDLYTQVIARIGHALLARMGRVASHERDAEQALENLIRLRLYNYVNDRLFFEAFTSPPELEIQPKRSRFGPAVVSLYDKYLAMVADLVRRAAGYHATDGGDGLNVALGLEGIITAFMGYWAGPRQSDSLANTAARIKEMLLRGVIADQKNARTDDADTRSSREREIHITSFDMERLKELIAVVRAFGREECRPYLDALDAELTRAKIANPREVPPDLITMNSRVRLTNLDTGSNRICCLVFPKDRESKDENVSILDSLGMAMLGHRVRDIFVVESGERKMMWLVEQILYQPEAAGDYHR